MAHFSQGLGLRVKGVVQGVGFRPFVYRLAVRLGLTGGVRNTGDGVYVAVYGEEKALKTFLEALRLESPPLARIDQIEVEPLNGKTPPDFVVLESEARGKKTHLPPDVATCEACLAELFDPQDRRYRYPFINCTDCGPRFTVIEDLPYDREKTTLKVFPMCPACLREYGDPSHRRFHAEPNACPECGPRIWLTTPEGEPVEAGDPLRLAIQILREGKILALRGLGGFHLAVDATNEKAVHRLREKKRRPQKPLAIMVPDLETATSLARLSPREREALVSFRRPIVLAASKDPRLAPSVAPGLDLVGLMLPYTPLHHLLLREGGFLALVMTSGNRSGEPLCYDNQEALKRLRELADLFLLHNREIVIGLDDSVVREIAGKIRPLRRARGFVPEPLPFPQESPAILATGALLKNTFCLARAEEAFLSQHIGDLENLETEIFFKKALKHLEHLLEIKPEVIACDRHPDYLSTKIAKELARQAKLPLIQVPHHVAHAAAVMGEFDLHEALAVVFDGFGLGPEGEIWGGEILLVKRGSFSHLASLRPVPLPGGDQAAKEGWRMGLSYLELAFQGEALKLAQELWEASIPLKKQELVFQMINKGLNAPPTSSCGRLFDAVAALLGLAFFNRFEGEAPMRLEGAARRGRPHRLYPLPLRGKFLDTQTLIREIVSDLKRDLPREDIARAFHESLAKGVAEALFRFHQETGVGEIVLSGGCFQNALLSEALKELLEERGLRVFLPERVPLNDGGISYGQALWAAWSLRRAR